MPSKRRCCAKVWEGYGYRQCSKMATTFDEAGDLFYCATHNPEAVQRRRTQFQKNLQERQRRLGREIRYRELQVRAGVLKLTATDLRFLIAYGGLPDIVAGLRKNQLVWLAELERETRTHDRAADQGADDGRSPSRRKCRGQTPG